MRKAAVITWLLLLLAGIVALFWRNDWVYNLPAPVPLHYKPVKPGTQIHLARALPLPAGKPLFLHFYNPDCPCSRFNIPHFRSLVKQFEKEVSFAIVLVSPKKYTAEAIREQFDLGIPVLFNTDIAGACGVYAAPQAVIIDTGYRLYYRGNYNSSRYCTDTRTAYAKMALAGLLHHRSTILFDQFALKAYGCGISKCTNQ